MQSEKGEEKKREMKKSEEKRRKEKKREDKKRCYQVSPAFLSSANKREAMEENIE